VKSGCDASGPTVGSALSLAIQSSASAAPFPMIAVSQRCCKCLRAASGSSAVLVAPKCAGAYRLWLSVQDL
jgi:hypothetical protein